MRHEGRVGHHVRVVHAQRGAHHGKGRHAERTSVLEKKVWRECGEIKAARRSGCLVLCKVSRVHDPVRVQVRVYA